MSTSGTALEVVGLGKAFRSGFLRRPLRPALRDVTFAVSTGEIFGYLGPNGSGKTTTLKIIMGLIRPDVGSVYVLGHSLRDRAWRHRAGYLPEHPYFYDYLSASEYLTYVGRLIGMRPAALREQAAALLEQVRLKRFADQPLRRFSKGMLQRLGIAQALLGDPDILFLDEPMSGLDPLGRRMMRDVMLSLKERGKTIFFSTHILSDAETLCDRVALLRAGELLEVGALAEILRIGVAHMEVLLSELGAGALDGFPPGVVSRRAMGDRWRLDVEEGALGTIITAAQAAGGRVLSVQPVRQSLEDYFVERMQEAKRVESWISED